MPESTGFTRRHFLTVATAVTGGVGAIATAVPFVSSFRPSARAQALGAPVEVDVSKLEEGALLKVEWRGRPIYILHRSEQMLEAVQKDVHLLADPSSEKSTQPAVRAERSPQHSTRLSGSRGRLHAPRLRADAALRGGAGRSRSRLAGRLLLPVPRLEIRSRRARVCRRARRQPTSSCRRTATSTTAPSSSVPTRRGTPEHGEHGIGRLRSTVARPNLARRVDRRALPDDEAHQGARHRVLRVEEFQHLVRLRRARDRRVGHPARHRHLPHDELQALRGGARSRRSSTSCATSIGAG